MSLLTFNDVRIGDTIRVRSSLVTAEKPSREHTFVVASYSEQEHNRVVGVLDGEGNEYDERDDDWNITVIAHRNLLPDADYIAWVDDVHVDHIATRYGHPENRVWKYNGTTYSAEEMIERFIKDSGVHVLVPAPHDPWSQRNA